ncbi:MAG: sugar phosphate isomerase/epimerase family protein [Phycisphaerae bacterium]|jgi:sugar phosphate isomerase/epimerase|nr:sugar phosphate isomerase/epimerase family protein [Phycisphaerae bacterium]
MSQISVADRLGVCSWSLQPSSVDELIEKLNQIGIEKVQLALDPLVAEPEWSGSGAMLAGAGIEIVSGMFGCIGEDYSSLDAIKITGGIVPDETWEGNWENIIAVADLADSLDLPVVSFHAGFLPESPDDPSYAKLTERIREIATLFAGKGVDLALETGQEEAGVLKTFLDELGEVSVGVNFDPANMILYGKGDPVAAVEVLMPYLRQVHIKDALPTAVPGTWGSEEVVGTGAVDWDAFLTALDEGGFDGAMCIEREAGSDRAGDIAAGRDFILSKTAKEGE